MSLHAAGAVFIKDIRCELRSKSALGAVLLFAVTSTIAVSFVLSSGVESRVAAVLLWLVIYFSAMSGLSRSFVREVEGYTAASLKLACGPNSVFLGKLAFNLLTVLVLDAVAAPLYLLLAGRAVEHWSLFIGIVVLGSVGMSVGATSAAAMVSRASTKGALYAVISFPLLLPVLAVAMHGTSIAIGGGDLAAAASDLRLLAYYFGLVFTASVMLFRFIWED